MDIDNPATPWHDMPCSAMFAERQRILTQREQDATIARARVTLVAVLKDAFGLRDHETASFPRVTEWPEARMIGGAIIEHAESPQGDRTWRETMGGHASRFRSVFRAAHACTQLGRSTGSEFDRWLAEWCVWRHASHTPSVWRNAMDVVEYVATTFGITAIGAMAWPASDLAVLAFEWIDNTPRATQMNHPIDNHTLHMPWALLIVCCTPRNERARPGTMRIYSSEDAGIALRQLGYVSFVFVPHALATEAVGPLLSRHDGILPPPPLPYEEDDDDPDMDTA